MCYHINTVDTKRSPNGTYMYVGLPDELDQMFMAFPQKLCFKKSMCFQICGGLVEIIGVYICIRRTIFTSKLHMLM